MAPLTWVRSKLVHVLMAKLTFPIHIQKSMFKMNLVMLKISKVGTTLKYQRVNLQK